MHREVCQHFQIFCSYSSERDLGCFCGEASSSAIVLCHYYGLIFNGEFGIPTPLHWDIGHRFLKRPETPFPTSPLTKYCCALLVAQYSFLQLTLR